MKKKTKVIFRKYKDGEIIALFPMVLFAKNPSLCQCYVKVGQHGSAHPEATVHATKPAKPEEYDELLKELERIGYDDIKVIHRIPVNAYYTRVKAYINNE